MDKAKSKKRLGLCIIIYLMKRFITFNLIIVSLLSLIKNFYKPSFMGINSM